MKRWIAAAGSLLLATTALQAQTESAVIEQLNKAADQPALNAAIQQAKGWGLPEQMMLEAQLGYGLRTEDLFYLKDILPRVQSASKNFNSSCSCLKLQSEDQWRGMIAFAQALLAREEEDAAQFEKHVLQAIWLYPEKAAYFGQTISQYQRLQRLSRQTLNLTQNVSTASGASLTLGDLTTEGKALLLIFWSKNIAPAEQAWEQLSQRATPLKLAGIAVAGVSLKPLGKEDPAVLAAAKRKVPLLIDIDLQLSQTLEVRGSPQAVLLSVQGKVLHVCHPDEPSLLRSMRKLAPTLDWR